MSSPARVRAVETSSKQRAFAEQVEVFFVDVGRITEALAGFAVIHPTVLQAGDAAFVKLGGAVGALQSIHDARVNHHQDSEQDGRDQQPPGRDDDLTENEEGHDDAGDARQQPGVADPDGTAFLFAGGHLTPFGEAAVVLGPWIHNVRLTAEAHGRRGTHPDSGDR